MNKRKKLPADAGSFFCINQSEFCALDVRKIPLNFILKRQSDDAILKQV